MVVMEGVSVASGGGGSGSNGVDAVTSSASAAHAAAHRSWYDQAAALSASQQAAAASSQQGSDEIDAYFKAGSNASSYFSQMQGAYSGMSSYHGNLLPAFAIFNQQLWRYILYR